MKKFILVVLSIGLVAALVAGYFLFLDPLRSRNRSLMVVQFIRHPESHPAWVTAAKSQCGEAPFIIPTDGYIGYLWNDTFKAGHRHQGIDIFGGTEAGVTAVYAAYDGYLTRLSDWKSTVIIRIPDDPLHPGQQIWTYYTHMADVNGSSTISPQFPAGTSEVFVEAGTFLGTMGNYSGTPGSPTGVHLHFSIVKDDGTGQFENELEISNTIDPSEYFGLTMNADADPEMPVGCGK
jgi:murein DD-endopeptidase MepM/ murein hydrolase activator NlpD